MGAKYNIKLKNAQGEEVVYTNVDTISLPEADTNKQVLFSTENSPGGKLYNIKLYNKKHAENIYNDINVVSVSEADSNNKILFYTAEEEIVDRNRWICFEKKAGDTANYI